MVSIKKFIIIIFNLINNNFKLKINENKLNNEWRNQFYLKIKFMNFYDQNLINLY